MAWPPAKRREHIACTRVRQELSSERGEQGVSQVQASPLPHTHTPKPTTPKAETGVAAQQTPRDSAQRQHGLLRQPSCDDRNPT